MTRRNNDLDEELIFIPRSRNENMVIFCDSCGSLMRKFSQLDENKREYFCRCGQTKTVKNAIDPEEYNNPISDPGKFLDPVEIKQWKEKYAVDNISKFKCPSCGSTKGELKYKHMRSYAKPTNLFIICSNCGKMVRKSN